MKKAVVLLVLLLSLVLINAGCDWDGNYLLMQDQTDFFPESGADQYVLCQALQKALADFDFSPYANQKISFEVKGGTSFSQEIASGLVTQKLEEAKAKIIPLPTEDNKQVSRNMVNYYLNLRVLACGVHSYNGIFRKNIEGLALVNLKETGKDNIVKSYAGKLKRYRYEGLVLSPYFMIAILSLGVFLLAGLLAIPLYRLYRKNRKANKK